MGKHNACVSNVWWDWTRCLSSSVNVLIDTLTFTWRTSYSLLLVLSAAGFLVLLVLCIVPLGYQKQRQYPGACHLFVSCCGCYWQSNKMCGQHHSGVLENTVIVNCRAKLLRALLEKPCIWLNCRKQILCSLQPHVSIPHPQGRYWVLMWLMDPASFKKKCLVNLFLMCGGSFFSYPILLAFLTSKIL